MCRLAEDRVVTLHLEPDDQRRDNLNREFQRRLQLAAAVHHAERREKRQNHRNPAAARRNVPHNRAVAPTGRGSGGGAQSFARRGTADRALGQGARQL